MTTNNSGVVVVLGSLDTTDHKDGTWSLAAVFTGPSAAMDASRFMENDYSGEVAFKVLDSGVGLRLD